MARSIIREASSEHGLDGRAAWDLMLATSEAVANAVLHGTACEAPPGDGILLRVEYCEQTLCVEVCDCGCFEGNGVNPAPTDALHGRGLPIIEAVVDHFEVQTEERLTRVRFGKRRAA